MQTQKLRTLVLAVTLGALCLPNLSHAQAIYGSIFGTVNDNTGAVVPNATITVTDESKGTSVVAQSNGSGDFTVQHLIPDTYDIKVTVGGFKTFEQNGIAVAADTSAKVDVALADWRGVRDGYSERRHSAGAEGRPRGRVDGLHRENRLGFAVVQSQLHQFAIAACLGAQQLGWSHAADENPQGSQQIQIDGQAFGGRGL